METIIRTVQSEPFTSYFTVENTATKESVCMHYTDLLENTTTLTGGTQKRIEKKMFINKTVIGGAEYYINFNYRKRNTNASLSGHEVISIDLVRCDLVLPAKTNVVFMGSNKVLSKR